MNGESAIRGNTSVAAGGGGVANEGGIVRLNDEATINDNTAPCCGGLDTWGKGAVTMAESSTIRGNKAESGPGGGVSVRGGTFKMSGLSSISANTALQSGGGLVPHSRHPHGRQLRTGHLRQRLRQQPQRLLPVAIGLRTAVRQSLDDPVLSTGGGRPMRGPSVPYVVWRSESRRSRSRVGSASCRADDEALLSLMICGAVTYTASAARRNIVSSRSFATALRWCWTS